MYIYSLYIHMYICTYVCIVDSYRRMHAHILYMQTASYVELILMHSVLRFTFTTCMYIYICAETGLGRFAYPDQMGHFYSGSHRLLDQLVGNQIIRFVYLNMVTVDSEHLSASHCHSSEHNSVSLVF